jgi:NAD(P)-dependent dehydrogenase (short-subunit alcohol dehydrogenase family)
LAENEERVADRLGGKVLIATGAGSGIGRASAIAMAREGARVVIADVDEAGGRNTLAQIERLGGAAAWIRCDVSDADQVQDLVQRTVDAFGRVDGALNNAGIMGETCLTAECTLENWSRVIGVNLTGVWLCLKYEIAQLTRQGGGGSIVNLASVGGLVGSIVSPAYGASKHGVIGLTRTAALQYAARGIRINAICPSGVETPMTKGAGGALEPRDPMARICQPEEVAEAVVWLLSDAASFTTGHALTVDGGFTAR